MHDGLNSSVRVLLCDWEFELIMVSSPCTNSAVTHYSLADIALA